ncbi:hypothetical protein L7F22_035983 [Adiantum nelumboides]|nr:hypothetical protein [Adiantum nelumboides]
MQRDTSVVVTDVRGTPGYIAPEWLSHGTVGKKSDVYSLGMVMLEIVGGWRNVDLELIKNVASTPDQDDWHFVSWAARKCEQGLNMELVDKRLQGDFIEQEVLRVVYSAFWCMQEDPGMRPYVSTLVQWLEGSDVKQPPFLDAAHGIACRNCCLSALQLIRP